MSSTSPGAPTARLLHHRDFVRLWLAQGISSFGSMAGGPALSFTAILFLHASPAQLSLLAALQMVPALVFGLHAGAWVDRVRRRPLLIAADLVRCVALVTVPAAALAGVLRVEQLYAVAFIVSVASLCFDLAHRAYLPSLLPPSRLLEGNSRLAATSAVSEVAGFGIAGTLVAVLTAPLAVLVDAVSFLGSAWALATIRRAEPPPERAHAPAPINARIVEGIREVLRHRVLRTLVVGTLGMDLAGGIFGALVVLYMSRELGFDTALLTPIWAVGGLASLVGATVAARVTRAAGVGPAMALGVAGVGIGMLCVPAAPPAAGATVLAAALLIASQLIGDLAHTIFDINRDTLRQTLVASELLGRVGATTRLCQQAAAVLGTLLGGVLGTTFGVRTALLVAGVGTLVSAAALAASSLWRVRVLEVRHNADEAQQEVGG